MKAIGVKPWTKIPDYIDAGEMTTGLLSFDEEKCKRCGICASICPARSIKRDANPSGWRHGYPWLESIAPGVKNCIACGCCLAACPEGAIRIDRQFNPGFFFQRLTQTRDLFYPRCHKAADPAPEKTERTKPDPAMVNPRYGFRQVMKMKANKLLLAKNALSGVFRFFMEERRKGKLFDTLEKFLKKEVRDISWAELLAHNAGRVPDKTFLMYKDESFTYREMDRNANRMANYLLELGGARGRGLGILMRNSPRYLDAFFGAQKIGMYSVTINPELKGEGLAYVVNHSDIDLLLVDAELLDTVQSVTDKFGRLKTIIVNDVEEEAAGIGVPAGMEQLGRAYRDMSSEDPGIGYDPEDICLLMYTSGTTGPPKGVVYRYNKSSVTLMSLAGHIFLKESDVLYTPYALCHGNALLATTTMTLGVRATMAMARKFSASHFWDDIRKYQATTFNTLGSIIPILMKQPARPDDRDNKVRFVNSAACPAEMWAPFEKRFGVKLFEGYGAIDGGGKGIFNFGNAPIGSLGKVPKFIKYRIVDENGDDVPAGVPGELLFEAKDEKSRVEYYKNEEASRKKSGDGWLHTGDLVKEDRNGFVYFVGRNTESMRRGGENVSAYEVEHVIMEHPAVEDVAVYAVPSELAEDEIMAAIKLVNGQRVEPGALIEFLSDKLARFAVPRYIRFVDGFPKTNSHRIIKRVLEEEGVTTDTFDSKK